MEKYDMVVLGSGPGGRRAAVQAAKLKKRVLIIEKDEVGGGCLHRGTIPSKTLREAAMKLPPNHPHPLKHVFEATRMVVQAETLVVNDQLHRNGVEYLHGVGSFINERQISVACGGDQQRTVEAEFIVIATGAKPHRSVDVPFNDAAVFDGETILNIRELPRRMVIMGAGIIGCEYASLFARLGVRITLLDRRYTLLRAVDEEIVRTLQKHFIDQRMTVLLGCTPTGIAVETNAEGRPEVSLMLGEEKFRFDAMLHCMGRVGIVENLNLKAAGIDLAGKTLIPVNHRYQTQVPHIYAVGDVIGAPALAASSAEQGRLAAMDAFGITGGKFPETFPYGIYTMPEISSVGAHEQELESKAIPFVVGRAYYRELARGKMLNNEDGFLKLLVDRKTRKILGVHILGTGATELIHIGQVAMALGADIDFMVNNVFNYPTLAEAYKVAAYAAYNQLREEL